MTNNISWVKRSLLSGKKRILVVSQRFHSNSTMNARSILSKHHRQQLTHSAPVTKWDTKQYSKPETFPLLQWTIKLREHLRTAYSHSTAGKGCLKMAEVRKSTSKWCRGATYSPTATVTRWRSLGTVRSCDPVSKTLLVNVWSTLLPSHLCGTV